VKEEAAEETHSKGSNPGRGS